MERLQTNSKPYQKYSLLLLIFSNMAFILSGCGGNHILISEKSTSEDIKVVTVHQKGKQVIKPKSTNNYPCKFHGDFDRFAKDIRMTALRLKSQKIYYSSKNLADCSGIYFRFVQQLQKKCRHIAIPNIKKYRSSRDIAFWYYQREQLTFTPNPLKIQHMLQPGMVVFYGTHNSRSDKFTEQHIKKRRGIHHLGIIISVERDKKGRLTSYTIFHGRNKGKYASTTTITLKQSRARHQPLGLYNMPLVAVAPLMDSRIFAAQSH